MSKEMLKLCFLLALGAVYTLAYMDEPFIVKFQWNYINYTWPSPKTYEKAKEDGFYIPRHNFITGIKVYKDRIYLAIPRLKLGVPVTLASINATAINGNPAPLLEPFPNWHMQKVGDCEALQSVQNMEIDPKGKMWVLDSGREMNGSEGSTQRPCGASLRIFDLENPNSQLRSFVIPAAVADPSTAHLYDIVLDHEDGGMAYISDADPKKPGIIVFSLQTGTFWKISHSSVFAKPEGTRFIVDHQRFLLIAHIHALALSPASTAGNRTLYYTPLSSIHIYSIPTNVLKNKTLHASISTNPITDVRNNRARQDYIDSRVKILGRMDAQSDSMIISNTGVLYYSDVAEDAIIMWDSKTLPFDIGQRMLSRDHHHLQWPASFAFDNNGTMWCLTNRMHLSLNDSIYINEPNFWVIAANESYTSYQYLEDGSVPPLLDIRSSGADSLSFNASLAMIALFMYFMF